MIITVNGESHVLTGEATRYVQAMMDKLWDCQSKLALAEAAIDAVIETDHNKIGTAPGSLEEWNHMEGHRCAAIPCIKYRQRWPKEDRG